MRAPAWDNRGGFGGIAKRTKGPRTTRPAPETGRPSDLVERRIAAAAAKRLWVADIAYVHTFAGWGYAAWTSTIQIAVAEYIDRFNHGRLHGEIRHVPPAETNISTLGTRHRNY